MFTWNLFVCVLLHLKCSDSPHRGSYLSRDIRRFDIQACDWSTATSFYSYWLKFHQWHLVISGMETKQVHCKNRLIMPLNDWTCNYHMWQIRQDANTCIKRYVSRNSNCFLVNASYAKFLTKIILTNLSNSLLFHKCHNHYW